MNADQAMDHFETKQVRRAFEYGNRTPRNVHKVKILFAWLRKRGKNDCRFDPKSRIQKGTSHSVICFWLSISVEKQRIYPRDFSRESKHEMRRAKLLFVRVLKERAHLSSNLLSWSYCSIRKVLSTFPAEQFDCSEQRAKWRRFASDLLHHLTRCLLFEIFEPTIRLFPPRCGET